MNGKRPLFKGVNRAETDPKHGRHVPRAAQERDVALMEQLNVNAVRTSHYPSDPYFYDLADEHGIWIDDEVDIETHNHENCANWCEANQPEWRAAFLDRLVAMVERDKNHPSVFMWDTGNEAGLGAHHFAMADWLDANEPTRPIYHQSNNPDGDAPFADVWGPRYPSPEKFAGQAESTTKPLIFGEYAHAMGNSLGNFREFWDIIRAHPQTQGGFIWDWAEQSINQPVRTMPDSSGNKHRHPSDRHIVACGWTSRQRPVSVGFGRLRRGVPGPATRADRHRGDARRVGEAGCVERRLPHRGQGAITSTR